VVFVVLAAYLYYEKNSKPEKVTNQTMTADRLEQKAITAIESKFQINKDDVSNIDVEAVDWLDSSLGCPKIGEVYAQVVTLGYNVNISMKSDNLLKFHTNEDFSKIVECTTAPKSS